MLLTGVLTFASCEDKLDIIQKGAIGTDEFYKTDEDCEKALAAAYEGFMVNTVGRTSIEGGPGIYTPAKVLANHPGDDVNYGGGNYGDHEFGGSIDEFRYLHTPEAINAHYRGLYLSVFKDNLVIDHFNNPATDFQKQAVAEARVLRAYNFFLLACYWGQPPFVDHLLDASAIPVNSDMTQQQYYEWVAKECEDVLNDLTERKSKNDKEGAYRVTKGFANALAGKAYMFAGQFEKAKAAFVKVITSEKYDLVSGDDYLNLFHLEGDGCPEKVFEINMKYNPAAKDWSTGSGWGYLNHSTWMEANCFNWRAGNFAANPAGKFIGGIDGWGSIGIPEWYGEAFHAHDGDSKRFKATLMNIEDAVYQTSGVEGMGYVKDSLNELSLEQKKKSAAIGIADKTQGLYGQSFYLPFKMMPRGTDVDDGGVHGGNVRLNNIIVMRYAEVLLDYAECCIRTNEPEKALPIIQKIQTRAGSKTHATVADMSTLINEKAFELWFEGCRYQDIMRWNEAADTKNIPEVVAAMEHLKSAGSAVPHLFDKVHRAPKDGEQVTWQHGSADNSRFYIVHTHEAKDAGFEVGWKEKHRLFPYPQSILDNNILLHQNTGWE